MSDMYTVPELLDLAYADNAPETERMHTCDLRAYKWIYENCPKGQDPSWIWQNFLAKYSQPQSRWVRTGYRLGLGWDEAIERAMYQFKSEMGVI